MAKQGKAIKIARWVLVIPSAFVGWYLAFVIGILLYQLAEFFCPPELMVSESCQASWFDPVFNGLFVFGASLSAVLVILLAVLMAPAQRRLVAIVIYFGGCLTAMEFAIATSAWPAFAGAIASGALILFIILRRAGKNKRTGEEDQ